MEQTAGTGRQWRIEWRIEPWTALRSRSDACDEIDAIFFASSNRQAFASAEEREAFRDLWLGLYLREAPELAFCACDEARRIVGYVVGWDRRPDGHPRFRSLGYFAALAPLLDAYPAHLHINVSPDWRSAGVGAGLIARLKAELAERGVPGVHIVTGQASRNVGFYERNGFAQVACVKRGEARLVMMGVGA